MSLRQHLLSILLLASGSATVVAAVNIQTVTQQGRAFSIKAVQVIRGGTIRFNNTDSFVHQIYIEAPAFNFESDEQAPGEIVDVTFPKSGSFEVRCHIHPKMLLHVDAQ